jgi:hypothetical protein
VPPLDSVFRTYYDKLVYDGRLTLTDAWVAWTGVAERALAIPGAIVGDQWDVVMVVVVVAGGGGAASYRARISATTGWVVGDSTEHYTSLSTLIANPVCDSIPSTPAMFKLTAANLYYKVIPDVGTTTGNIEVFACRRKGPG